MAIFNQFRVINPNMFVESTWLDDIVTARVPLLVLRNFLTPEVREAVVTDLQSCREKIRVSHYPNGALTTLGPYLGDLAAGARLTALACALALAGGLALGIVVALMRTAASPL